MNFNKKSRTSPPYGSTLLCVASIVISLCFTLYLALTHNRPVMLLLLTLLVLFTLSAFFFSFRQIRAWYKLTMHNYEESLSLNEDLIKKYQDHVIELQNANALLQSEMQERTLSDRLFRVTNERLTMIFECAGIGIAIVNQQFQFTQVNPAFQALLGYTQQEMKEMTVGSITHPENLPRDLALADKLAAGEIPYLKVKTRFISKEGTIILTNLTVSALRDRKGNIVDYLGCADKISCEDSPVLQTDSMDSV